MNFPTTFAHKSSSDKHSPKNVDVATKDYKWEGPRGCRFLALVRRRRGSISAAICDRGATQPKAKSGATRRAKALLGVWAALLATYRPMKGMLVTRVDSASLTTGSCQPPQIAFARSSPIYEIASNQSANSFAVRLTYSSFNIVVTGGAGF